MLGPYKSVFFIFFFWILSNLGAQSDALFPHDGSLTSIKSVGDSLKPKTRNSAKYPFEIPYISKGEQMVSHFGYRLVYSEEHEQSKWIAYELTAAETHKTQERTNRFLEDPMVYTGSASDQDYKGSGYDRGHLAPAADMGWSETAMEESFYYSNMSPQEPSFNRGIWKKGEERVRIWAQENEALFVVVGPVLEKGLAKIGPSGVSVPKAYFKVVLDFTGPEKKGIAFFMANEGSAEPLTSFVQPIDSIEKWTGLNFFPQLNQQDEHHLEGTVCLECWSWGKASRSVSVSPHSDQNTKVERTQHMESSTESRQCQGTTKKGNQCRRMTKSANGYCWQHGG